MLIYFFYFFFFNEWLNFNVTVFKRLYPLNGIVSVLHLYLFIYLLNSSVPLHTVFSMNDFFFFYFLIYFLMFSFYLLSIKCLYIVDQYQIDFKLTTFSHLLNLILLFIYFFKHIPSPHITHAQILISINIEWLLFNRFIYYY